MRKPLLVGEDNPYGSDPRYALYPLPLRAAGHRLQEKILEVGVGDYIRGFGRVNLCSKRWEVAEARRSAGRLIRERKDGGVLILLGAKVAAFNCDTHAPFTYHRVEIVTNIISRVVRLPHPSGRCREWNEVGAYDRARVVLREAGVLPLPERAVPS